MIIMIVLSGLILTGIIAYSHPHLEGIQVIFIQEQLFLLVRCSVPPTTNPIH